MDGYKTTVLGEQKESEQTEHCTGSQNQEVSTCIYRCICTMGAPSQ